MDTFAAVAGALLITAAVFAWVVFLPTVGLLYVTGAL